MSWPVKAPFNIYICHRFTIDLLKHKSDGHAHEIFPCLFNTCNLLQRMSNGNEHEATRRIKTQFLIEMEGFDSGDEQVLVIGNC